MNMLVHPKADVLPNPVAPFVADIMEHIVSKWGHNDKKYWIGNRRDQSLSMHITNNLMTLWAWALMHKQNPAIDL